MSQVETSAGQRYYGGDPHLHGINTTRGAVADAIASMIFANPDRADSLRDVCEHLVCDPTIAVRSCAADICTALLLWSPPYAVRQFTALVECDDMVLATKPVGRFLRYALRGHFTDLRPALDRMLRSADDKIAQAGARLACLAAFDVESAVQYAEAMLHGRPALRRGAAEVYSHNLISGPDRPRCEAALTLLFHDGDESVRRAAVSFLLTKDLKSHIGEIEQLLHELVRSPAFIEADDHLFHVLDETTDDVVDLLFAAVERFLVRSAEAVSDIRSRTAATAGAVSGLLIRVYAQARDDNLRTRSLDLIDRLIAHEAFGMEQALDELGR